MFGNYFIQNSLTYITLPRNIFIAVCLCFCLSVCVSVCVSDVSCEQIFSRTDEPIWTQFSLNGCLLHWLNSYWNWWPWIKRNFGMSLRYTLDRLVFKFHKNRMGDDVIVTSLKFLQTTVQISNSIEPTNFVLWTNTQQHNIHLKLMIRIKVILTDDEGHRGRSKVTKKELMVISCKLLHSQTSYDHSWYQGTIQ